MTTQQVTNKIKFNRKIEGASAVLLPFASNGTIDFDSYAPNVRRTLDAGLTPAVNMDTGYSNLLTPEERTQVLRLVQEVAGGREFIAGAFIEGQEGDVDDLYAKAVDEIQSFGGTPIIFQSSKLKALSASEKVATYAKIGERCKKFLGFELGEMFLPFGEIYSLEVFRELMQIPTLTGAKHSSLNRILELQRLELRDEVRPDFKIYTGNDLAIDLVMYGSDYLLGLSAFSPEAFALRDKLWEEGDARFYGLNDLIQYLGFLAFRPPVPAYKHNCAQFLALRGRIATNKTHAKAIERPASDIAILQDISDRLDAMVAEIQGSGVD
jgi:dihydrodipicolinate synthase/N-acetylneuraminate lyase